MKMIIQLTIMSLPSLLSDSAVPTSLLNLDHNIEVNKYLYCLAHSKCMPHLIIQGMSGSGKKLRIALFLKEKYGNFNTSTTTMWFKLPGKSEEKSMTLLASRYHYQFNPNIHNMYDRVLMQAFINEIIHYKLITGIPYRIIVIEDADLLTVEAQEALRKTLETHIETCRFIFLCNNEGRIIDPIYSRCNRITVVSPNRSEITSILSSIAKRDNIDVPSQVYTSIIDSSHNDLRKALNLFEKYLLTLDDDKGDDHIFNAKDHDSVYKHCNNIIDIIAKGSDLAATMDKVRLTLYELVNYCADHRYLILVLLEISVQRIPKSAHNERYMLCTKASEIDESIRQSSKAIYHVEGFCVFILAVIKTIMEQRKPKKKTQGEQVTKKRQMAQVTRKMSVVKKTT